MSEPRVIHESRDAKRRIVAKDNGDTVEFAGAVTPPMPCYLCAIPCKDERCSTSPCERCVTSIFERREALRAACQETVICQFCGAIWGADESCTNDCELAALLGNP